MLSIFKKRTRVILDTNFLMIPGELGLDIFSEIKRVVDEPHDICILDASMKELEVIIEKNGRKKEGFNAKLGYIMAKQKGLKIISSSSGEYADEELVNLASKDPKGVIVATQDSELKRKIKNKSARIIELRNKSHLALR